MILDHRDYLTNSDCTTSFDIFAAPQLLQYYILMLETDRIDQSGVVGNRLLQICKSKNYRPLKTQEHASNLENEDKPLEALLFNLLSIHHCFINEIKIDQFHVDIMTKAFEKISTIVKLAIRKSKLSTHIAYGHIIPNLIYANGKVIQTFNNSFTEFAKGFAEVNANQSILICRCQPAAQNFIVLYVKEF